MGYAHLTVSGALSALQKAGFRITSPRRAVVEAVVARDRHFTWADVVAGLVGANRPAGRATVFRTLELLEELRLIGRVHHADGRQSYVVCPQGHHHHAICSRCCLVLDLPGCPLSTEIEKEVRSAGFRLHGQPLIVAVGAVLASLLMVACGEGRPVQNDRLLVAASISPLADFASQVGGERVQVITLVPPGASPHTYELTPSQVRQVSRARALVLNGVGLDYWVEKLIQSANNPNLLVVDTSKGIEILEGDADEQGGNPHVWLDPKNAVLQVEHVRDALVEADPARSDGYRGNAERYVERLLSLDQEIAGEVDTWSSRQFIAFHPAWVYFAERYGLVQAAVIEESPGREPSPAEVAEIVDTARSIGARAIFAEPQFSSKAAETIAEESGAKVLFLDPLGSGLDDPSYVNLMRYNVAQMAKALR